MPKLKLSRLRDISWSLWDPIGLLSDGQNWRDEDCQPFADEYDGYLMQAASRLGRGAAQDDVARYLADIVVHHMGMGTYAVELARAKTVVAAIQADDQLWICTENP